MIILFVIRSIFGTIWVQELLGTIQSMATMAPVRALAQAIVLLISAAIKCLSENQ